MCFDVIVRQGARIGEGGEPPGSALLTNDFCAPYQIALAHDPEMQRDRAALAKACCSPRVPQVLKRAPKPEMFVEA